MRCFRKETKQDRLERFRETGSSRGRFRVIRKSPQKPLSPKLRELKEGSTLQTINFKKIIKVKPNRKIKLRK